MLINDVMKELLPMARTKLSFFPRDLQFWSYHSVGLALFILIEIVLGMILVDKPRMLAFESISFLIWAIGFTLSTLTLRIKYTRWSTLSLSAPMLVVRLSALVTVLALIIFLVMSAITVPPYWDQLMARELAVNANQTPSGYITQMLVGNWFSGSIILSCWLFIYISISKSREVKNVVKESQLANLRLENSLKEAQLSSLSNQLNPHFLFNSLNNIRFMIHENADQADDLITSLSHVLRYSLESSQHEKLPLYKELDIIYRYVAIVAIQFENRFRFTMDIPDTLHDYLIPPMLLQMLIENAVKHGVEQMEQGSSVEVSAKVDGHILRIEAVNDAPKQARVDTNGTGLGLKNIEQRLNILYGSGAKFSAKLEGSRFRVAISLPTEEDSYGNHK
ncbi:MAG: sensor histidine kinase YesM [Arenicella sp.]|jgi:sensor histidine kinase YesM